MDIPCKNRELGCLETVPYVGEAEMIGHEEVREHREYVCPVPGSSHCDWLGPRAAMLAHCRDQHPDNVLDNPCSLTHDIARASVRNYIVTAFQVIFLLHTKVCVASGKLFHAVQLLGTSAETAKYYFNLDIKRNNELLSKEGQVASQDCLAIQEPTSLAVNINSVLDVLGGFDGLTFTVTVKRRVSDAVEQLASVMKRRMSDARMVEKCAGCAVEVTVFLYRGEDGWRCERCAPARRACEYQDEGCTHTDIDEKCWKHETYFCQQRTHCSICWTSISQGSLFAHYGSVHQDITHRAGSMWRVTQTGWNSRDCLVSSVAGTAVSRYTLDDSRFVLYVHTPVPSERLSEFRCEVRLTDPATGHARTFTSDVQYNEWYDWVIEVYKAEFSRFNTELYVSVEIRKAES